METIIELIEKSDLNKLQKNIQKGNYLRGKELIDNEHAKREIVIFGDRFFPSFDIVVSMEDVIIYKLLNPKDKWDIEFPYRIIFRGEKESIWTRVSTVCASIDEAMLTYLEHKHLDGNSRFANFACKMLAIKMKEI